MTILSSPEGRNLSLRHVSLSTCGLCDRIEDELGAPCEVVATGGLAGLIVPHCSRKITFSDTLLLDGLKIIWDAHGEK